jgi:hypothetical protein
MVNRRPVFGHVGEAYVALCVVLAALASFPTDPSYLAYYGLLIATVPVGLVAAAVTYLGGVLLFGPDPDGIVARSTIFILWVVFATAQMIAVRALIRASRRKAAPRAS